MATTSAEIQYALDRRGFVEIDSGATITVPIQLAHLQGQAYIDCPGDITYAGPPGRWAFEWDWQTSYSHTPARLLFENIDFSRNSVSHGGFLRINPGDKCPQSLSMKQCEMTCTEGYAVDANGVPYIDSVYFEDVRTTGASSIRWISNAAKGCGWGKIKNWRHHGGGRVGASFMFKNMRNLIRRKLIDEQSPSMLTSLRDAYYGPIGFYDVNCVGYCMIHGFWSEPWGSWATVAPGCWLGEIRADETSGGYDQYQTRLVDTSINAGGIDEGVAEIQVTGGDTSSNAASLRVDFDYQFKLKEDRTQFAGKSMPVAYAPWENGFWTAGDRSHFDNLNADTFRDSITSAVTYLPYELSASRVTYVGSNNETNYTAEPAQYDA